MSMKKNKKAIGVTAIIIIIIVIIFILVVAYIVNLYQDKQKFTNASVGINNIMKTLAVDDQYRKQDYCIYNDLKYSKGKLLCFVTETAMLDDYPQKGKEKKIETSTQDARWMFRGNNSLALEDSTTTYTIANLYKNGKLDCYIREQKINEHASKLEVGCSGSAKAEWFPVRES